MSPEPARARGAPSPRAALCAVAPPRLRVVDVALFYGERSGGIRTYLDAKVRWARGAGRSVVEHHVVVPGPREVHDDGRHELPALRIWAANGYRLPIAGPALERTIAALAPDVVLLHDPFWRPLRVAQTARAAGATVVAVHHGSGPLSAAGLPGPARAWLPLLRAWMTRSAAHVDAILSAVDPRPDTGRPADLALRLGVDEAFRPQPGVARGDETVYVGRLGREKGVLRLVDAAALSDEPWTLRLVGAGPLGDAVRARARRHGIERRLRFSPFVADPRALARVYAGARCVVMPGEHETFGLVGLEAACSGARVVACASAPAARVVGGALCDTFLPGDTAGLADAIAAARATPAHHRAAGALAARHGWPGCFAAELAGLRALAA